MVLYLKLNKDHYVKVKKDSAHYVVHKTYNASSLYFSPSGIIGNEITSTEFESDRRLCIFLFQALFSSKLVSLHLFLNLGVLL